MSELIYPTLDLFVYDLRNALNESEQENYQKQAEFQAKLPKEIFLNDSEVESEYLELLPQNRTYEFTQAEKGISGYYYPVRLNDTYGLLIDCSIDNKNDLQSVEIFSFLKQELSERIQGKIGSIGQTWMISGWYAESTLDPPEKIAKSCYHALVGEADWEQDLQGEGNWWGGKIFELWHAHPLPEHNWHVIVTIYPNQESAQKGAEFIPHWMGLFCYRNKIWWAYCQSRLLKKSLVEGYQEIENNQKHLKNNLDLSLINLKLAKIHQALATYAIDLPKLNFQKQIIDINLLNYKTRLKIIHQQADSENQLKFLTKFNEQTQKKYLVQITKDSENMELGLRLLENTLKALDSQIEAEKANRDRLFQNLVTIIGTGTAGTALIDTEGKKCQAVLGKDWCKNSLMNSIGFPIFIIVVLGLFVFLIKKIIQRSP